MNDLTKEVTAAAQAVFPGCKVETARAGSLWCVHIDTGVQDMEVSVNISLYVHHEKPWCASINADGEDVGGWSGICLTAHEALVKVKEDYVRVCREAVKEKRYEIQWLIDEIAQRETLADKWEVKS